MYVISISSSSISAFAIGFNVIITFLQPVRLLIAIPICKYLGGLRLPDVAANTLSSEICFILCVLGAANLRPTQESPTRQLENLTKSSGVLASPL